MQRISLYIGLTDETISFFKKKIFDQFVFLPAVSYAGHYHCRQRPVLSFFMILIGKLKTKQAPKC
uniref:Uncharacterized protein n=1 Tax=Oryza brachyantha TaxID=4533 RepID=J3L6Z4_ORYBR